MDRLTAMEVFVRVAEEGGFSSAARRMGISKAGVSKHIQDLEEHLQTRLLHRTTRRLQLTSEGLIFFESCRHILNHVHEAEEALSVLRVEPSGLLRMNAPMSFGYLHLAPALVEFLEKYPLLRVDMVMNDRYIDLVEEGFDLALRIGQLEDSGLIAKKLAPIQLVLCASPIYLEKYGTPSTPEALIEHVCLIYALARNLNWEWRSFFDPDRFASLPGGRLRTNNGDAIRQAAVLGLGLAILPTFLVGSDLQNGTLRQVLADFPLPESTLHAVYPHHRHLSPKVRACIDFLSKRFGGRPYWDC
ncbi:MAG: LysR family transcriptional regulator [Magnetococcus sp. DMHC-6]